MCKCFKHFCSLTFNLKYLSFKYFIALSEKLFATICIENNISCFLAEREMKSLVVKIKINFLSILYKYFVWLSQVKILAVVQSIENFLLVGRSVLQILPIQPDSISIRLVCRRKNVSSAFIYSCNGILTRSVFMYRIIRLLSVFFLAT